MLEPGYDIESACKARLTSLFQKVMPESAPAGDACAGPAGVEHHESRKSSVFDQLDAIPGITAGRDDCTGAKGTGWDKCKKEAVARSVKPCDSQAVHLSNPRESQALHQRNGESGRVKGHSAGRRGGPS